MNIKAPLPILFAILALTLIPTASAQNSGIFGVFSRCEMACRYIKIDPDGTFEELLDGDLFNGQRKKGVWSFIDKGTIRALSQKPSSALQVRETAGSDKVTTVTVLDMAGAALSDARISGNADGRKFECITNSNGFCEIPKTSGFELEWNHFKGSHLVINASANRFEVELTYEQMDTVIDEVWKIEGNHLYVAYEGTFDKTFPLKRVPLTTAQKLFPRSSRPKP